MTFLGMGITPYKGKVGNIITALDFTGITNYAFFGDSIATGQGSTARNSYRLKTVDTYSTTDHNGTLGARGVWVQVRNLNQYSFTKASSLIWLEAGLNDLRKSDSVQTSNKLQSSLKTALATSFTSSEVAASGSSDVTRTGTFTSYDAQLYGGIYPTGTLGTGDFASSSQTLGDTWEWTFTGDNLFIIFGASSPSSTRGECEVRIDGVLVETITDQNQRWDGVSDGANNNELGPDTRFYNGLSAGSHTVIITISAVPYIVIDQLGVLDTPANTGCVFINQIPYVNDYTIPGADQADAAKIDAANLLRENIVNYFKDKGYKIAFVKVMKTNGGFYDETINTVDDVHPSDAGYLQWFNSAIRYINVGAPPFSINHSFLLDGVSEYFTMPLTGIDSVVTGANKQFTILSNFKRTSSGSYHGIFTDDSNNITFRVSSSNLLQLVVKDGTVNKICNASTAISDNIWHTGAVSYDYSAVLGSRVNFYLDTTLNNSSDAATTNIDASTGNFNLWALGSGGFPFQGNGQMLAIINRVLSPAEIAIWDNGGKPLNPITLFGADSVYLFNPDDSGSTAQFSVVDSTNSITATSVNLEDADKTTTTPY
jgi:hypothetical protein